jgi:hypothetical protein
MNYRSVVVFGTARIIEEPRLKIEALRILSEHLLPGRWADVRGPNKRELTDTLVLRLAIEEASAKTREGPPSDEEADYARDCWAGVLPLAERVAAPIADARLAPETPVPDYLPRPGRSLRGPTG